MKRFIVLHESRICADGWLHWWVAVLGALALATTAAAGTAYYSFTGAFTDGTERQSFLFNTDAAISSAETFSLRTWHYVGGINAAGESILGSGFDPLLRLYSGETLAAVDDDIDRSVFNYDAQLTWRSADYSPPEIAIHDPFRNGDYRLELRALSGGGTHWAVDLVGPADRLTLTGVEQINNTGATTINSLKMGSNDPLAPASLQVGPLENLSIIDGLVVGNTGVAEVAVTTGSLSSRYAYLGLAPGSVGSVTLSLGGYLEATSGGAFSAIGFGGEGNLRVESGSLAIFSQLDLGEFSGAEGNVTVTGNDSYLLVNGGLVVSDLGVGYLRVQDQGHVNSAGTVLGFSTGGHGTGEVDGLDSLWQSNGLIVGNYGQGTVRITSGGKIDTTGDAYIGYSTYGHDSSATLTGAAPNGTPSTWLVSGNLFIAGDEAGPSSAAFSTLAINPGGLVDVAGTATVWNNGGNLKLLGGEMETGSLIVKPGATFTHTDGTLTVNGGTFDPGTPGYIVDGAVATSKPVLQLTNGAVASISSGAVVGMDNHGQLEVYSGARFITQDLLVGRFANDSAYSSVLVSGHNSAVVASGQMQIGSGARGRLDVLDGGKVTGGTFAIGWAYASDPHGYVRVEGSGSTLDIGIASPGVLTGVVVGWTAPGELHILNGAAAESRGGETSATLIGQSSDVHGILEIRGVAADGSRSRFSVEQAFEVGQLGRGDLFVEDGGLLSTREGFIAAFAGSANSQATVSGSMSGFASTWNATSLRVGGFRDGPGAEGKLTVADGGQVIANYITVWQPGTVELNNGGINSGGLELAGGTLRGDGDVSLLSGQLTNAGIVAPGLSAGVLNINGDYVQGAAGTLAVEIGGPALYQFDRLQVNGSATLHGLLDVSLIDTGGGTDVFQPNAGDAFEILTAAGGLGGTTFATEMLPTLRGGLFFGVLYNPNDVTLVAAGVLGDYNRNGAVDAADYVVWRKTFSGPNVPASNLVADGDGDRDVDQGDFIVWRSHFGQIAGSGALADTADASDAIPEPATLWLAALAAAVFIGWARRTTKNPPSRNTLRRFVATLTLVALAASTDHAPALAATWGFDSSVEGWQVVSYPFRGHNPSPATSAAIFDASFGLPPGSICVGDVYSETGIAAPNSVLGNRLDLYGEALSYNVFIRFTDNVTYPAVSLNGGTASVYYDLPSPQVNVWEHVTIPLSETGWRVGVSQVPATQSQFQSVLSTLNGLYIYTEWHSGDDDTNVDNVTLGAMIGLPGDYNQNGVVDAADYVVWRKNLNTSNVLPNDPIGGMIGHAHYEQWRTHFGQPAGSGALAYTTGASDAIPEPSAILLLALGVSACVLTVRGKQTLRNEIVRFADRR